MLGPEVLVALSNRAELPFELHFLPIRLLEETFMGRQHELEVLDRSLVLTSYDVGLPQAGRESFSLVVETSIRLLITRVIVKVL